MAVMIESTVATPPAMAPPSPDADLSAASCRRSQGAEMALVERHRAGDASAFDELVADHQARVRRLAHRLLGWSGEAEDVVQEVFLAAFSGLRKFDGRSSLSTWLTAITLNKCRTHRRRKSMSLARLWEWWERRTRTEEKHADADAEQSDTSAAVRSAVQSLPPRDREVIILHYLEQLDVDEIAKLLALTRNATEVRLHRARNRLKERLATQINDL